MLTVLISIIEARIKNKRRKIRSQTSDLWTCSNNGEKSQRRESQEKEDKVREKVAKSRNIIFCEGQKVGSLKQRVQRHIVR